MAEVKQIPAPGIPQNPEQAPKTLIPLKFADLVDLSKKVLKARQTAMEAQIAELQYQTFQIELAKRYEVADKRYAIDWQTGKITVTADPPEDEPQPAV